jgi:hypothetical protein
MSEGDSKAEGTRPTPIPYVRELHFDEINSWFQARTEVLTPESLPKIGYVIPGKAAGFLYQTDSSIAWIENLVAAPTLGKEERNELIDLIVLAVGEEARRRGFKVLLGYTVLDAVVKRAQRLGFDYVGGGFHLIALHL